MSSMYQNKRCQRVFGLNTVHKRKGRSGLYNISENVRQLEPNGDWALDNTRTTWTQRISVARNYELILIY